MTWDFVSSSHAGELEANDPRKRDLYARNGYQGRGTFALPDGAVFWPMWRPAAP
ncbi:hypothetical protein [Nonomuraea sp. B1E8]|uniref:hypothetical protein n=1 Tax=unclassified Nonomuraea TaxID=2593643 RepID=UPI00325DA094